MSLGRKATEGTLLSIGAAFGDRIIGFLVFALVVRYVEAREVGLVALCAQFVDLANAVATSGLGERVMQRRSLDPRVTATLFWTHALISLPVMLLLAALGPLLAWFLEEPLLQPLLLILSASLMLNVFVTVPAGLLAREMRYRPITLLSVLSTLVGGAVALTLAFTGYGLWALALQRVAGVGFYALGTMVVTRYWPILAFDHSEFREAVRFALPLMGSQALIALPGVVTMTAIGRNLGVEAVGQLRIAQRLSELMVQLVISPVMRVFIPVFSAMSDNRERLRDMLRRVIDALALPVLPMFAVAAVVAGPLTRLAFGPGWDVSASLFQILSLAAPLVVVSTVTWPALVGIGRTGDVFRLKLFEVVITVAVALAASPFGVFAYVWASIGRAAVQLIANAWLLGRAADQRTTSPLMQLIAPAAASASGFAGGHWLVAPFLPPMHPVLTLAALGAASGAVAALVLALLAWSRLKELVLFVWRNVSPAARGAPA
ncbi:oligosaccharide flippase family protein [Elioraea sp.]|uniref:oligosaccharide flippase family protein n=1 Tax=Elioraea sp. TaxID=2185103 RepID=UPI0025C0FAAF|nr:oligosaccharide flippase family protein [Elioraea sp.]